MTSIPGNFETSHLPDFRTVVIWLRIIGMVNAGLALGILAANQGAANIFNKWVAAAVFVEPLILLCLSALYLVAHWLAQFPRRAARALVVLMVLLATAALHGAYDMLGGAQFGLDTEGAEVEDLTLNGYPGYYYTKNSLGLSLIHI